MFRTILVPLDGTPFAEAALPVAARLAKDGSAVLHLACAHQHVPNFAGMEDLTIPPAFLDEGLRSQESDYLTKTVRDLAETGKTAGYLQLDGPAGPAVCAEALRLGADLVVMATHGRGPAGRFWHGSVADYVVRHLTVPVLLVHPHGESARFADQALRGVLVALDLSTDSEAILPAAAELARLTRAPVTLMHVLVEPVFEMGQYIGPTAPQQEFEGMETRRVEALGRLEKIADRLRKWGLRVTIRVTPGISAARTLGEAFRSAEFDVLAMTTHGATGLRRLWMGSVADQLVRGATKPVLVFRPPLYQSPTPGERP